jgi:hypothetical protein
MVPFRGAAQRIRLVWRESFVGVDVGRVSAPHKE